MKEMTMNSVEFFLNEFEKVAKVKLQGVQFKGTTNQKDGKLIPVVSINSIAAGVKFTEDSKEFLIRLAEKAVMQVSSKENSDVVNALVKTTIDCNEFIELYDGLKKVIYFPAYINYFEMQLTNSDKIKWKKIFKEYINQIEIYFMNVQKQIIEY